MDKSAYRLKLYLIFEEEARMFGMAMSNFFNFVIIAVVYIIAPMLIGGFGIDLGWWYYIPGALILISLWIFLKAMGKKAYPNFVMAFLSQKVMQPKILSAEHFRLNFTDFQTYITEAEKAEAAEEAVEGDEPES